MHGSAQTAKRTNRAQDDKQQLKQQVQARRRAYADTVLSTSCLSPDTVERVLDYLVDDLHCLDQMYDYPHSRLPIALLCYGDHNVDVFLRFAENIRADGDTDTLAHVIMAPIQQRYPDVTLWHLLQHESESDECDQARAR